MSFNCCSLAKCECYVSQGRVETLFRSGEKRLHFCMTNLLRTICTKFYHNRSDFVDCISKKTFWCVFFGSQCSMHVCILNSAKESHFLLHLCQHFDWIYSLNTHIRQTAAGLCAGKNGPLVSVIFVSVYF